MAYINPEDVYNRYAEDVIRRNETALAFKKQVKEYCDNIPLESVKKYVEDFYRQEAKYHGEPKVKTDDNDFAMFKKNIRYNVIIDNFAERPETLELKDSMVVARERSDEKALNEIVNRLYTHFYQEIKDKKLEEKVWKGKLVFKTMEIAGRKIIGEDFQTDFDPMRDKGNCTKAITVSLYRAADNFGLSLFPEKTEKENFAHPKDLAKELEQYVKTSESGELRDIPNIQKGDIVLLSNGKGEPRHAMMVSGFDEQGEPLLLGFTPTQKNVPMFERKADGTPRKGCVIDIHAFIADKVQAHNRAELSQIMFAHQNNQSVK